jgi:hypothetical protein
MDTAATKASHFANEQTCEYTGCPAINTELNNPFIESVWFYLRIVSITDSWLYLKKKKKKTIIHKKATKGL